MSLLKLLVFESGSEQLCELPQFVGSCGDVVLGYDGQLLVIEWGGHVWVPW